MALYIPHSIFHLARLLYVTPETFGPYYAGPETFGFTDTSHYQMVKGIKSWASRGYNTELEKAFKADRSEPYRIFSNTTQCFVMDLYHNCPKLRPEF